MIESATTSTGGQEASTDALRGTPDDEMTDDEAGVPQSGEGELPEVEVVEFMTERTFGFSGSDPGY